MRQGYIKMSRSYCGFSEAFRTLHMAAWVVGLYIEESDGDKRDGLRPPSLVYICISRAHLASVYIRAGMHIRMLQA